MSSIESMSLSLSIKNAPAKLYRWGRLVWLSSPEDAQRIPSGYTAVATIPDGWAPRDYVRIPYGNRTDNLGFVEIIGSALRTYANKSISGQTNCAFSAMYFV